MDGNKTLVSNKVYFCLGLFLSISKMLKKLDFYVYFFQRGLLW